MALSEAQWPRVFEARGQGPTQEEIDQAKRQRMEEARQQARRKPSEAEELFDVLDVNHDGMLSREEFAQAIRSKMKQQVGLQAPEQDTLVRSVMGSTIEVPAAEPLTQRPPGPQMMPVMPVPLQQLTGGPGPQMQPMGPPGMQRGAPNGQMLMPPHGMMIPVGPPQGSPPPSGPMQMGPPPVRMMPAGGPIGQGSPPPSGPMQMGPPPVQMVPAGGPPGSPPPSGPMQMGPPPVQMVPAGGPPGSPPPSGPMQMGPPPMQMVPAGGPRGQGSPPPSGPMQMGPPPMQMAPSGGPPGSPPPSGPMQMGPPPVQMVPVGGPPGSPPPSGPMQMGPPPVQMLPVGGPPGSPPPSGPMQMGPPPVQMMPGGPSGPMMPMPMEPSRPFGPGPGQMQLAPPGPCRPFGPPGAPGMPQGPLDVTRRYSGPGVPQQQMVPLPRTNPLEVLWSQSQMQAQRLNYMEGEIVDVKKMIQMMVERQNKASFSEDSEKASRRQRAVMAAQRSARLKDESSPDSDGSFIANMRNHSGFEAKSHVDLASPTSEEERRAKLRDAKMGSMSRMPNPNQSIEFALPVDRPDPFMPSDGYDYGDSYGVEELKGMHQSLHGQTRDPDSMMSIEFHKRPELGGSLRQDAVFTPGGGSYDDPALGFGMPGQNPSELRGSMNLIKKDWNMDDKYIPNEMYEKDGAHHESISGNPIPSLPTVRQDRRDEACQLM